MSECASLSVGAVAAAEAEAKWLKTPIHERPIATGLERIFEETLSSPPLRSVKDIAR
jgi:hypothetical protein